jgi:DNA-directed RNA polymerase specialized sigma subunit
MTQNQTRADTFLRQIREVEKRLKNKRDEVEALRYKASGAGAIRYDKDRVQTSPNDYLAMAMSDILELEKQIEEDVASIEDIKGQAYMIVRQMEQPEHRTMIEWFYLNGVSMTETAERMAMSERTAYYLRDDALESFGQTM